MALAEMEIKPGTGGKERRGDDSAERAHAQSASEEITAGPSDSEMQDDFEMESKHRSASEMEQEHGREDARLRIGEHRQTAAFVGIP